MATRLKPSRINVDNNPSVWNSPSYQNQDKFKWSEWGWGGWSWDMQYSDFEWVTLTWSTLTIEDISNSVTPSSDFTVTAGTVKPGIEYVLRVNTGNTPYTMTLWTGVTNPNWYGTELTPNTINQFKFIATSTSQLELEWVDSAVVAEVNWGDIWWTLSDQEDLQNALDAKLESTDLIAGDGITIAPLWSDLPDWYTQLQSISSSGSQYILTWINYVSWHTYEFTHKLFVNSATDASKWTWWNAWGWLMMINQSWIKYSWGWTSSIIGDAWQELEVTISVWNWTSTYDYTIWWTTWSLSRSNTSLASYAGSISYPLFVSTVNNGWWTIYSGSEMTATYYYFEAKDNNVLVRKMYPAKRNADNAIWMYDVVNNVFYANNWSWSFVPWPIVPVGWLEISAIPYVWWTDIEVVLWEAKRLPNWYTEVEYIQSDGNCYIDTLVNTVWTDYIENHFQKLWSSSTTCAWFGSWEWNNLIRFCIGSYSSQQLWRPCFFGWYNYTSPIWTLNTNKNVIKFYYAWWTYYQTLNDGGPNTYVPQNIWTNPTITSYMFARHWADWQDTTYDNEWTKIFYHLQKDVNWVNKMELIPCVRDSDDEPGFYDLVNERFLANWWSWTLTAWPVVTYNPANVINYTGEGSNTKTFYLANLQDTTTGQDIRDRVDGGWNAIVYYSWMPYFITAKSATRITLYSKFTGTQNSPSNQSTGFTEQLMWIDNNNNTITITNTAVWLWAPYLATNQNYATVYTPLYNGSPATKKYVDDAVSGVSTDVNTKTFFLSWDTDYTTMLAVANWYLAWKNPIIMYKNQTYLLHSVFNDITEDSFIDFRFLDDISLYTANNGEWDDNPETINAWDAWYIGFRITTVWWVPDHAGDVSIASVNLKNFFAPVWDANTKTFYISSNSDLTNAQAAYDWYAAWKNPIVNMGWQNFILTESSATRLRFTSPYLDRILEWNNRHRLQQSTKYIDATNGTVTSVSSVASLQAYYLDTGYYYSSYYTPTRDWHPATKKYVDDKAAGVVPASWTAPSNPTEWQLRYDTTNDVLKTYDGTNWNETGWGAEYNAWKWIEIWIADDYSAIKWPCPDGFHIPTSTEANTFRNILINDFWRTTNPDIADYLNIPLSGYIDKDWTTQDEYEDLSVWTCTPRNSTTAFVMSWYNWYVDKGAMMPIRPFKDEPVIPSWDGRQIVWRADDDYDNRWQVWRHWGLWLISISVDLETWYTIADKNLWATVIYGSWDEHSANNVWNLYQRGNNYGIPYGTTPTTSQTQVDASWYWPWNYYSSGTIIRWYADRSSVENGNLRWWETWIVGVDNTITNIWVTSFNSKTWDVSIQAWRWIAIQNWITYLDDQWPCPKWYHVPVEVEIQKMIDVWGVLWWTDTNISGFTTAYKLPLAWYRTESTWAVTWQWTEGRYLSSSYWNWNYAHSICINSWYYQWQIGERSTAQAAWAPIRPFKNIAVKPDGSWTKLYWESIEEWWIFWKSSEWIISFSWDGTEWTTISDKNLWATAVWNSWDTLSETNCGWYFQRGNNYMFPFIWNMTTSAQKVDASWYWPGNYYSSSTFITSNNYYWTTTGNPNIWWWQTTSLVAENMITNTWVLSVNWQTWYVTLPAWDVVISDQPNNILTSWMKIRAGTQENYEGLSSFDDNTLYLTV